MSAPARSNPFDDIFSKLQEIHVDLNKLASLPKDAHEKERSSVNARISDAFSALQDVAEKLPEDERKIIGEKITDVRRLRFADRVGLNTLLKRVDQLFIDIVPVKMRRPPPPGSKHLGRMTPAGAQYSDIDTRARVAIFAAQLRIAFEKSDRTEISKLLQQAKINTRIRYIGEPVPYDLEELLCAGKNGSEIFSPSDWGSFERINLNRAIVKSVLTGVEDGPRILRIIDECILNQIFLHLKIDKENVKAFLDSPVFQECEDKGEILRKIAARPYGNLFLKLILELEHPAFSNLPEKVKIGVIFDHIAGDYISRETAAKVLLNLPQAQAEAKEKEAKLSAEEQQMEAAIGAAIGSHLLPPQTHLIKEMLREPKEQKAQLLAIFKALSDKLYAYDMKKPVGWKEAGVKIITFIFTDLLPRMNLGNMQLDSYETKDISNYCHHHILHIFGKENEALLRPILPLLNASIIRHLIYPQAGVELILPDSFPDHELAKLLDIAKTPQNDRWKIDPFSIRILNCKNAGPETWKVALEWIDNLSKFNKETNKNAYAFLLAWDLEKKDPALKAKCEAWCLQYCKSNPNPAAAAVAEVLNDQLTSGNPINKVVIGKCFNQAVTFTPEQAIDLLKDFAKRKNDFDQKTLKGYVQQLLKTKSLDLKQVAKIPEVITLMKDLGLKLDVVGVSTHAAQGAEDAGWEEVDFDLSLTEGDRKGKVEADEYDLDFFLSGAESTGKVEADRKAAKPKPKQPAPAPKGKKKT